MHQDIGNICSKIRIYSHSLFRHCTDVAFISAQIALNLGIPKYGVKKIVAGALLHDAGKLLIPKTILEKPGKLTPEEYKIVKMHPVYGYEMAKKYQLSDVVMDIILHHHETETGEGYPDGSTDIALETKIVSVADKYDAITSQRSYKNACDKYTAFVKMGLYQPVYGDLDVIYKALSQCSGI